VAVLLLSLAVAMTDADLLADAGRAFAEGLAQRERGQRGAEAFRRAAARFEELRERGVENAELLGNLGNAYLLAGDLPRAVLAYRQALRLSPGDRGLRDRLAFAREQVESGDVSGVGRPPDEPWPAIDRRAALALAALVYAAGWAALIRGWAKGLRRWVLSGALVVLVAAGGAYYFRPQPEPTVVVVARDGVVLRKGNGESFPPWFDVPLNRGVEASLLYRRGDWLQVELGGGEVGWVHARDVVTD
jgi:tetratricopeptide (TPR) repeat protein